MRIQWRCSCWYVVIVTSTWRHRIVTMATSKMSLGLVTRSSRRSSAMDYSPVSTIDDVENVSRLQSVGDVSLSVSLGRHHHHYHPPFRHRTASSSIDTGLQKDQNSPTQSVPDVLSASADELAINRRRERKTSMRVLLQTKIYNFLERPTGCRCFLYHFCVYVHFAFTSI